jgi:Fe-S-cluster-containing dehydrogenase component
MQNKRLIVSPARCIGCRTCELACAFSHSKKPNEPAISRIQTYTYNEDLNLVVLCLQCDEAACIKVCPTKALFHNETSGTVEVDMDKCIKCRMCALACPFGNIIIEPETLNVIKCDLCGGDPVCAKFCPSKTLEFAFAPTPAPSKEEAKRAIPPLPWTIAKKVGKK